MAILTASPCGIAQAMLLESGLEHCAAGTSAQRPRASFGCLVCPQIETKAKPHPQLHRLACSETSGLREHQQASGAALPASGSPLKTGLRVVAATSQLPHCVNPKTASG